MSEATEDTEREKGRVTEEEEEDMEENEEEEGMDDIATQRPTAPLSPSQSTSVNCPPSHFQSPALLLLSLALSRAAERREGERPHW